MSRGLGKIERAIVSCTSPLEAMRTLPGPPGPGLRSYTWAEGEAHHAWKPTMAQSKAVTRAMHSFVRKHQQYALTGGQGRRALYLYDATDPLSAMWARVRSEQRGRKFISRSDARAALNEQGG